MSKRRVQFPSTLTLRGEAWLKLYRGNGPRQRQKAFEKRWQRHALPTGDPWRVDETYLKVRGQWVYLYRAVDKAGCTVDFLLIKRRNSAAAQRFFFRAIRQHGVPRVITLEMAAVTIRGIELAAKINKQQFNLTPLTGKATTAAEIWATVLAA